MRGVKWPLARELASARPIAMARHVGKLKAQTYTVRPNYVSPARHTNRPSVNVIASLSPPLFQKFLASFALYAGMPRIRYFRQLPRTFFGRWLRAEACAHASWCAASQKAAEGAENE